MKNRYYIVLMLFFCVTVTPLHAISHDYLLRLASWKDKKGVVAQAKVAVSSAVFWLTSGKFGLSKQRELNRQLVVACFYGNKEDVEFILKLGEDVNFQMPYHNYHHNMPIFLDIDNEISRETPLTALFKPCYEIKDKDKDNVEIVVMLLGYGANINMNNGDGDTPLFLAVNLGRVEGVKVLLEKGAWINARNKWGNTALMLAVYDGNVELVRILLKYGAWVNLQNEDGKTALTIAESRGLSKIVELLLQHGAQPIGQ